MAGFEAVWLGRTWTHFHVMFAASVLLRWIALALVRHVREPNSHATSELVVELVESIQWRIVPDPKFPRRRRRAVQRAD